ncbi:hypothetical protein HKK55_14660 [Pseudomonas sp. ADAK18]|uniref:hypothetical protein n=1 Tax=Pseudomonas sp. ADAK18 TaxID=2730848 RepID=UPI0014628496|nr:hypothetical protein [Pseudomonas sp. ADAK18]QJI29895.1 hypothetical protein HKK55_14660 [Pseudomonas sp. ADAK18]
MSYGLRYVNNNDVVTLDSEFSRLVVLEKGTWSGFGSSSGNYVKFSKTITTAEPPLVFVRPTEPNTLYFCLVNGTQGAWAGFSFYTLIGVATNGKWFCAAFESSPTATYGMRLWDGSSKLLFDNGTPCAQFTRSITSWTYLGSSQTGQGQTRLNWTAPSSLAGGDYMLLNNIAMDVAGLISRQGNMYALWDYANDRLIMQVVGVDISSTLYNPVLFAKQLS